MLLSHFCWITRWSCFVRVFILGATNFNYMLFLFNIISKSRSFVLFSCQIKKTLGKCLAREGNFLACLFLLSHISWSIMGTLYSPSFSTHDGVAFKNRSLQRGTLATYKVCGMEFKKPWDIFSVEDLWKSKVCLHIR